MHVSVKNLPEDIIFKHFNPIVLENRKFGAAMFGTLFRLLFWGSLALLIFPINTGKNNISVADNIAQPGIVDTLFAARGVAEDLKQICDRQPEACVVGNAALHTIKERAKISAEALAAYLASTPVAMSDTNTTTGSITTRTEPSNVRQSGDTFPVPSMRPNYP